MPRSDFTQAQAANALSANTWPIFLVQLEHSSPIEYLSCTSAITYDGVAYTAGAAKLRKLTRRSATVDIRLSAARIQEVERGTWRGGACNVYYIPGLQGDSGTYTAAQGLLWLPGVIETTSVGDELVSIEVVHKALQGQLAPALYLSAICNHMPGNTVTDWEGEKLINDNIRKVLPKSKKRRRMGLGTGPIGFKRFSNRSGTIYGPGYGPEDFS